MILLLQAPVPAACRSRNYKRATQGLSIPLGVGVTVQGLRVSAEMRRRFERTLTRAANQIPFYRCTELQGEWNLEIVVHLEEQQQGYILRLMTETNLGRSILLYQSSPSSAEVLWRDADILAAATLAILENLVLYLIPPESRRNRSRHPGGFFMITGGLLAGVGAMVGGAVLTPKIEQPGEGVTEGEARLLVLSGGLILAGFPVYALGKRMWDRWPQPSHRSVIHAYNQGVLEDAGRLYTSN